jgi:Flp pilus assembly protein TadG
MANSEMNGTVGTFDVTRLERLHNVVASFWRMRDGNVAVTFALALIPVIGTIGAAVDYSKANDIKTQLQKALDAAVLAGVTQASSQQVATATAVFNGGFTSRYGSLASAAFTQNADNSLSGTATSSVKTSFLPVIGMSSIGVSAAATAMPGPQSTSPVCILLVNPLDAQALLVNSGAQINAPTCEIHVLSTQSPAAIFNATLNVKRICIKGSTIIKNGGVNPPAVTSCATISDPFAGKLPTVAPGNCIYQSPINGNGGTYALPAGTYCGGVNFNGSGTLQLSGLYVIQNGAMIFNSSWTVIGTDVTFYLVDENATITFNGNVNANLTAPTSGAYANILMFEPPGLCNTQLPINGTSGSSLTGLMYLPSRDVTINSVSNMSSNAVTMVFSTLILNSTNWTIAPGTLSMSVASGAATSAHLSR